MSLKNIEMNYLTEPLTFTVNFTPISIRQAETFRNNQIDLEKARQVYLNTLAVQTVNFYCKCIGVETDLSKSRSWDINLQTLIDAADLVVEGGRLECCSIMPGEEICQVSSAAFEDRRGYVVVEIDEVARTGKILGFSKTVENHQLPVAKLGPLDGLIDELLDSAVSVATAKSDSPNIVKLSQWFSDIFDELWQSPQLLLSPSYRGVSRKMSTDLSLKRIRAKRLDLGENTLILIVQVARCENEGVNILATIHPDTHNTLPPSLIIEVLDDEENVAMKTKNKGADEVIDLDFTLQVSEPFSIKISVTDLHITEHFIS